MEEALTAFPRDKAFLQEKDKEEVLVNIFDMNYQRVFNYMNYRLGSLHEAEELTSQVFERVLRKIDQFNPALAPFDAWLFAIARNVVNDHYRLKKRRAWLPLDSMKNLISKQSDPEATALQNEEQRNLLTAMAALNERERNLVALKFAGGLKNREIAQLTGLSESNVGVLLYRSLHRLREQLEGKE